MRAGTVGINGYQLEPHVAFGGYRQSGLGREGGQPAIEAYTELKTVLIPMTDETDVTSLRWSQLTWSQLTRAGSTR